MKKMRVLVTGVGGQLGFDAVNELLKRGHEPIGVDVAEMDITDAAAVEQVLFSQKPDAVIHCAAWTAVDAAEDAENADRVRAVNVQGTANIAACCRQIGAKMMYISTDYVFNGSGETPWAADCTDFDPLSVYGRTKLEGEAAVRSTLDRYFIVRIAWAFGLNGGNFVKTMLRLGQKHNSLRVVCDQVGTPTYTKDLSRLLVDMIETDKYGCYHATNEGGYISWADFAKAIFEAAGMQTSVVPVTTEEYGLSKAARPYNSRLDKSSLTENGFLPLPTWQDALVRYLEELENQSNGTN